MYYRDKKVNEALPFFIIFYRKEWKSESRTRNIYFKLGTIKISVETGLSLNIHVYRISMVITDFCITFKNSTKLPALRFLL